MNIAEDISTGILDTLNFLSIGFYRSTRDGRLLFANEAFLKLLGYDNFRELSACNIALQLYPDRTARDAFIEEIEKKGEVRGYEYALKRKDESSIVIRENARTVKDEAGDVLYYEGTIEDVTRRNRMEDELQAYHENLEKMIHDRTAEIETVNNRLKREINERQSIEIDLKRETELLTILLDNIPDAIYFKDRESRFIRINKAHAEVLNIESPEDACGKSDFHFFSKVHADEALADEQEIIRSQTPIIGKVEQDVRDDGWTRWVSSTKVPFRDENKKVAGIVGISRDISDLKEADESLRKKNEELTALTEELQRSNRDLAQFAAIASHDLQEPLRMVSNYVALLRRRNKDTLDETSLSYIEFAVEGAQRMSRLIDDLLTYSKVSTRDHVVGSANLSEVLETVVSHLNGFIKSNKARIVFNDLPNVRIDVVAIERLFQNLIQNAIKYNQSEEPMVEIGAQQKENQYVIFVKDNGIGIEPRYNDRIFRIFQRLHNKENYEGTGIGLALCQRIVERHGGRIWVDSVPGKGSTFYFTLPADQK